MLPAWKARTPTKSHTGRRPQLLPGRGLQKSATNPAFTHAITAIAYANADAESTLDCPLGPHFLRLRPFLR